PLLATCTAGTEIYTRSLHDALPIFKILNNGEILGQAQMAKDSKELATLLCEKALRYDLTIPFARYVVMRQHELALPFKRYQMQPDRKSTRLNSSHVKISYAVFCLKK